MKDFVEVMDVRLDIGIDCLENCVPIRQSVFVDEQGFAEEFDTVDYASDTIHITARIESSGERVACLRVFPSEEEGTWLLGRLAVYPEYRGCHLGAKLVESAEDIVAEKGGSRITLHAQLDKKGFYEKCGFESFRDPDEEQSVPHIWMQKTI